MEHVSDEVYSRISTNKPSKLEREDHVWILKQRSTFGKEYLSACPEEIHIVTGEAIGAPVMYKIKDLGSEF